MRRKSTVEVIRSKEMKHCEACSFEEELAAVLRAVTSEEAAEVEHRLCFV